MESTIFPPTLKFNVIKTTSAITKRTAINEVRVTRCLYLRGHLPIHCSQTEQSKRFVICLSCGVYVCVYSCVRHLQIYFFFFLSFLLLLCIIHSHLFSHTYTHSPSHSLSPFLTIESDIPYNFYCFH